MASLAACWISTVRVSIASSMSELDFSGICVSIRCSRVSRKASQSVCLLYRDGFCRFWMTCVYMFTISPVVWVFTSCECCVLYRNRSLRRADPLSRGVLPSIHHYSLIKCNSNPLHLQRGRRGQTKNMENKLYQPQKHNDVQRKKFYIGH